MPNVPGAGSDPGPQGTGTTGAVGTEEPPGPVQLERAWHGLMYTMAGKHGAQVSRMKTVNSVAKHLRQQMKGR